MVDISRGNPEAPRIEEWRRSLDDADTYWLSQASLLDWMQRPTQAGDWSFDEQDFHIRWFADGVLNASVECVDRHLPLRRDQPAIIWEPDEPDEPSRTMTFGELHLEVCRFANLLLAEGVRKGDRVTVYLPMIPEAVITLLACARIGAIHSVVFGGFSAETLADRINDCESEVVITADAARRGGRRMALKTNVDAAAAQCPQLRRVLVVRATGAQVPMLEDRDRYVEEALETMADACPPEPMNAEDPLFILYTSGSTGKPKGVVHSTGGYLLWATATFRHSFQPRSGEIFWCTADIGWITGHSYTVYGSLATGVTTLLYEGLPNWPTASRMWQVVDRHKVAILYTAPTAIRSLMAAGDEFVLATDRSSLRVLGSVGEPIDPQAWRWYHGVVGEGRCPVVDTWWQTETGGHMITAFADTHILKPGAAQLPFFGVEPVLLDVDGRRIEGAGEGRLALARSWPGQMRSVWGDPARFFDTYFRTYPGYYFTGDGARRDEDGEWWITGRVDDVINVSGHRLGTAEVESALVAHADVAEAAVVGFPHDIKGQGIYCYVTLCAEAESSDALVAELREWVRKEIGPVATPDVIQLASDLPKTRSGKIVRRILRKIAEGDTRDLGDLSTLIDASVVDGLIAASSVGRGGHAL